MYTYVYLIHISRDKYRLRLTNTKPARQTLN